MADNTPGSPVQRHPLSFGAIVGLATLMGLVAGSLFGLRETVRVSLSCMPSASLPSSLSAILSVAIYAVFWHAVGGGALLALVGVLVWAACRVRRLRLSGAAVLGLGAAAFALVCLPPALWYAIRSPNPHHRFVTQLGRLYAALEVGGLSLVCAVGFGALVYRLARGAHHSARLAAGALGVVCAAFALSCWGLWLHRVVFGQRMGAATLLADALLALVAVGLGLGVYFLCLGVLRWSTPEAARRRVWGALLTVVAAAALAAAAPLLGGWAPPVEGGATARHGGRPARTMNVVWLVLDSVRADALSCGGGARRTTPYLDRLAAEGVLYERAFSASSWTLPSQASMFTGLLPRRHGATRENLHLDDRFTTLAELLLEHGYRTLGISANPYVSAQCNTAQGFQRFVLHPVGRSPKRSLLIHLAKERLHLTDYGARDANATAREWVHESVAAGEPFFLFINYMEAHWYFGSTPGLGRWFKQRGALRRALGVSQNFGAYLRGTADKSPENFRLLRLLADGDLTYLDSRVGELVEYLRSLGILDNTLLIVTSDHGDEFGEHGLLAHTFGLYNTLLHVPLIIRCPEEFRPGTRVKRLVRLTDIFPTILDVLKIGWDGRPQLDGRSLLAPPSAGHVPCAVAERYLSAPSRTLGEMGKSTGVDTMQRLKSIQTRDFKYIWYSRQPDELYDLTQDPLEARNLIDALPEKAAELRAALEARVGSLRQAASLAPAQKEARVP